MGSEARDEARFEYKFVRVDSFQKISRWRGKPSPEYREQIQAHARQGWRLSQLLKPYGYAYYELIFERPVSRVTQE